MPTKVSKKTIQLQIFTQNPALDDFDRQTIVQTHTNDFEAFSKIFKIDQLT